MDDQRSEKWHVKRKIYFIESFYNVELVKVKKNMGYKNKLTAIIGYRRNITINYLSVVKIIYKGLGK